MLFASRQRSLALLLLALVAAFMASTSAPHPGSAQPRRLSYPWRLTPVASSHLPELNFILSTPAKPGPLRLVENGVSVPDYTLAPVSSAQERFGVVLLIDASQSMKSREAAAVAAAREFTRRRQGNQLVGVMAFNNSTTTLAPLSADDALLSAALNGRPLLAQGTRIYDAVSAAVSELVATKVDSGSVILLSDGSDTGSKLPAAKALKLARAHHVRVFSVGLRSQSFDPSTLKELAQKSGGLYVAASPRGLTSVYDRLSDLLASEYLLRYQSRVHAGGLVHLSVSDGSTQASASYVTPLQSPPVTPQRGGLPQSLWTLLAVLVPSLLIYLVVLLLLSRRREGSEETAEAKPSPADVVAEKRDERKNPFASTRWWKQLEHDVELAQIELPTTKRIMAYIGIWVALCLVLMAVKPLLAFLVMAAPLSGRLVLKRKLQARRKKFAEQFPETLQVVASALRAGHSLSSALRVVADDSLEPTKSEYRRVLADERLGFPLDEALSKAALRMENKDLEQVAVVAQLQTTAGGNTAEVFDRVVETVRSRADIQRTVKALTAQGRMARWIVTALPIGLAVMLFLLNPSYIKPLFTTLPGQAITVISLTMLAIGSVVIKKIVEIEI